VPEGIDPGWAHNPGKVPRPQVVASSLLDRVAGVPAPLGAAAYARVMPVALPAVRANWREWVDDVLDSRAGRPRREQQIAGVLAPDDLRFLRAEGISPVSAEIAVSDQLLVGRKAARHEAAKNALTPEQWRSVPDVLAQPQAVYFDTELQGLIYVSGAGRAAKIAVLPDFLVDADVSGRARLNSVRTAFVIDTRVLRNNKRYRLVRGELK